MKKLLSITLVVLTLLSLFSGCSRQVEMDYADITPPPYAEQYYSYMGPNGEVIISTVPPEDFEWPGYDAPTEEPVEDPTEPADGPTQQPTQGTQQPTEVPTQPDDPTEPDCDHDWQFAYTIRPSCDVAGEVAYQCTRCGTEKIENVPAGHQFEMYRAAEGTCTEPFEEWSRCAICGEESYYSEPAPGHDYVGGSCTVAGTCSVCGATKNAEGHQDNGTDYCGVCGERIRFDASEVVGTPLTDRWNQFCFYASGEWWLSIQWYAANNSGKTISRFRITVEAYDASGNLVYGKTSKWRDGVANGENFGLTAHFTPKVSEMDELASFQTITSVKITQIEIEYADGSTMKGNYGFSTEISDFNIHTEAFDEDF